VGQADPATIRLGTTQGAQIDQDTGDAPFYRLPASAVETTAAPSPPRATQSGLVSAVLAPGWFAFRR